MLMRVNDFYEKDNDIYFMETVNDKVVINDNYKGVKVLDGKLKLLSTIKIFDGMGIYSAFIDDTEERILLYCPDNECFVYINAKGFNCKIIELKYNLKNSIFSNVYSWSKESIIVSTYNYEFYEIHLGNSSIINITGKDFIKYHENFYREYDLSMKDTCRKFFSNGYIIALDDYKKTITVYDDSVKIDYLDEFSFIGAEYRQKKLLLVKESSIEIFGNNCTEVLRANKDSIFLRGKFLNYDNIVILISDITNPNNMIISCYEFN